jgi:hypothetical protein
MHTGATDIGGARMHISFEGSLQLQLLVLAFGLVSFWGALACGSNPLCSWMEWIDGHGETAPRVLEAL